NLAPLESEPALFRQYACGFSSEGTLIRFRADGVQELIVLDQHLLPAGVRRGRGTIARGVLYLENWAVDLESGRVLWALAGLASQGALLPVADERARYVARDGSIGCLGSSAPGGTRTATGGSAPAAARSRASLPGSGPGVVLADGTRVSGTVTRESDGSARV